MLMRSSLTCLTLALTTAGWAAKPVTVSVTNPTTATWKEAPVVFPWKVGMPGNDGQNIVLAGKEMSAAQCDDLNQDGVPDEVVALVSLEPKQTKKFEVKEAPEAFKYTPRAHCGMYLKTPQMKGMEGPAWESDVIGFRHYWDKRAPIDIFGKTQPILSLDALAGNDVNYHVLSKWGQDVFKVGQSLGDGGFGVRLDGKVCKVEDAQRGYKILANGPVRAVIELVFTDWKVGSRQLKLTAQEKICGGQKWAETQLKLEATDKGELPEMVTGIVIHPETTLIHDKSAGIVGRWGKQALGDKEVPKSANLGIGVVVKPERVSAYGTDGVNDYVRLKASNGQAVYRYHASWEKEPGAAKSPAEYEAMLRSVAGLEPEVTLE